MTSPIRRAFDMWPQYNRRLCGVVAAMSAEQLAIRPSPEVVERSPAAARQLASRARRRVRAEAPEPDADLAVQRRAVDAFLTAARDGDFEGLLRVLDPDVVLRVDGGPNAPRALAQPPLIGAEAVARGAGNFRGGAARAEEVTVNGAPGLLVRFPARSILAAFTVAKGRIVAINIIADPEKLRGLGKD